MAVGGRQRPALQETGLSRAAQRLRPASCRVSFRDQAEADLLVPSALSSDFDVQGTDFDVQGIARTRRMTRLCHGRICTAFDPMADLGQWAVAELA